MILPSGITIIGPEAFAFQGSLTTLELPETIKEIRYHAFFGCDINHEVNLFDVEIIGGGAFYSNDALTVSNFPKTLKEIGGAAFGKCSIEGELDFSQHTNLREIGYHAFLENKVTGLKLPAEIELGVGAFSGNQISELDLSNITRMPYEGYMSHTGDVFVNSFLQYYDRKDGVFNKNPYSMDEYVRREDVIYIPLGAFSDNKITKLILPSADRISGIGSYAFGNNQIEEFVIPANFKVIGTKAFSGNSPLKKIIFEEKSGNGIVGLDPFVFSGCNIEGNVEFPQSLEYIFDGAFKGNKINHLSFHGSPALFNFPFKDNPIEKVEGLDLNKKNEEKIKSILMLYARDEMSGYDYDFNYQYGVSDTFLFGSQSSTLLKNFFLEVLPMRENRIGEAIRM